MRINQFVATATGMSRRSADQVIAQGRVSVNDQPAQIGQAITPSQTIKLDGKNLKLPAARTIIFNKPPGYTTSRRQQGATPTIYQLLPPELHSLKPVGRLDQDSSGLLILTSDGHLAQRLSHPSQDKDKVYLVTLDRRLHPTDLARMRQGVVLKDGLSRPVVKIRGSSVLVTLKEGRNRQIRRTFGALGYRVDYLHRIQIANIKLGNLPAGRWRELKPQEIS